MTDESLPLRELIEKSADCDFLREMIGFAADRLMALEIDALCGAGHGVVERPVGFELPHGCTRYVTKPGLASAASSRSPSV